MQKPKFSSVLTKRALVGLVILIILSLSTAFAADWEEYQVTSGSCPGGEEYIILELADDANSHVQLPGESSSYTYKLCLPESNEGEVIPIPDGSQYADLIRQCRGRNQVLSLFTPTNSHVESPEIGDYYEDLCFGFFENCRIQDKNIGVDGSSGEVFLAWASDQSNAHLFEPDASPVGFDYRLVCNVPFCGSDEIGDIYPILFDFEEESDVDFKIHNLVKVEPDLTIDPVSDADYVDYDDIHNLEIYQGWFRYFGSNSPGKVVFDEVYDETGAYFPGFELSLGSGEFVDIYSNYARFDQYLSGVKGASKKADNNYAYYSFNGVAVLMDTIFFEYNGVKYYSTRSWATLNNVVFGDVEQNYLRQSQVPSGPETGAEYSYTTTNKITGEKALRIDLGMDLNDGESRITLYDLYKTNWSGFDHLEFYVIPISSGSLGGSGSLKVDIERLELGNLITQSYDVSGFAPTKYELNKPSLIRIPINTVTDWANINSLSFYVDDSTANYEILKTYSFILDTFVLSSENPSNEFEKFYYCNGDASITRWSDNLDYLGNPDAVEVVPLTACESSDLYENNVIFTTETRCCGEELGEVYYDGSQGCYDGIVVDDGDAFDYVTYSVNGESFTSFCDEESCEYAMPVVPSVPGARFTIAGFPQGVNMEFEKANSLQTSFIDDTIILNITRPRYAYGQLTTVTGIGREYDVTPVEDNRYRVCGDISTNPLIVSDFIGDGSQITSAPTCSVVGDFYCSPNGFWSSDNSNVRNEFLVSADTFKDKLPASNRTKLSIDFNFGASVTRGCCPESSCWHDGQCWADQSEFASVGVVVDGEYTTSATSGMRCVDGNWDNQVQKLGLIYGETGFCASESQCLVSPTLRPNDGVTQNCIDSGEYYQDYYCNEGDWSTRTLVVANELTELADASEFRLYCDTYDKVSNLAGTTNTDSETYDALFRGSSSFLISAISKCDVTFTNDDETCVNNVCVLVDENDDVYFGTSFNQYLRGTDEGNYITPESVFNDINSELGLDCSGVEDGKCSYNTADSDGTWYYNNETKMILYSPKNTNVFTDFFASVGGLLSDVFDFINPFKAVPAELVPTQDIIQTLYRLDGEGPLEIAAFRIEGNQNRDNEGVASYVVNYAGASQSTIDTVCSGLTTYAQANEANGGDPIAVDCQTDSLLVNSSFLQSGDVWSRITVALRQ